MGSVITNLPEIYDQIDLAGNKKPQMTYVQFVPGVVVNVVTAADSEQCEGDYKRIGSITAMPHIGGKGIKKKSMMGEEHRYYPLMRGIQETPTVGDPVLLCTFGGIQYYMGPLNTEGNPNFNQDYFGDDELQSEFAGSVNTSPLFIQKNFKRMQKPLNSKLDNPLYGGDKFVSNSIHGDIIFEGRHGNSLRIGSRNENPYFILSNGRSPVNLVETTLDSTIFSIFHRGSIRQHFNKDIFKLADDRDDAVVKDDSEKPGKKQHILKTFQSSMGRGLGPSDGNGLPESSTSADDKDIVKTLYGYDKEQLFASSGRITFNAKSDSMFFAANKFIHFGSGNNITFSTSNTFLVNASTGVVINSYGLFKVHSAGEVYIDGRQKITLGNPSSGYDDIIHPAVLGESLISELVMIVEEIKKLAFSVSEAIENRKVAGGSLKSMQRHVDALDDIMGYETEENGNVYPRGLSDLILSKKVFLKV